MHIQANVTKAYFGQMYGDLDGAGVRKDCKVAKVQKDAWLKRREDGTLHTPTTGWVLSLEVRKDMNQTFLNTRFPTYHGAKIKNSVKEGGSHKPIGLKSHDYHKMMQHMFSTTLRAMAIQGGPSRDLCNTIYELSVVFR